MADGTEAKLQIYSVEEAEATAAVCVVRCVGGLVSAPGSVSASDRCLTQQVRRPR
jgi:hypothetical protein